MAKLVGGIIGGSGEFRKESVSVGVGGFDVFGADAEADGAGEEAAEEWEFGDEV